MYFKYIKGRVLMETLKSTFLMRVIVVSVCMACIAFMLIHSCHAQGGSIGKSHTPNIDPHDLQYGSYGSQMNRQQMNRISHWQGNLHLGSLKISPTFHERLQYDDNVYAVSGTHVGTPPPLSRESKREDLINIASPGLHLRLPIGSRFLYGKINKLDLNWQSDFKNYFDKEDQNQQNHYVVGAVTFEVLKGFDLTLKENWAHTDVGAGSETDRLNPRDTNTFQIGLRASQVIRSLKKLDIEVLYTNFDQDYTHFAEERANRNENSYTMNIYYNLTPKFTIKFPQYTYSDIRYDKAREENLWIGSDALSDSHSHSISGGVSWLATAKTTGYFDIGYTKRQYEKNTHESWGSYTYPPVQWKTSDVSSYTMDAGVTSRLPWKTLLDVNFYRVLRESEFTAKSNSYFTTGGAITFTNKFHKLCTNVMFGFFQAEFNGVNRKDDVYTFATNASYVITKWSRAEIGYSYKKKEVNNDFSREDEEINKIYFGFGLGL